MDWENVPSVCLITRYGRDHIVTGGMFVIWTGEGGDGWALAWRSGKGDWIVKFQPTDHHRHIVEQAGAVFWQDGKVDLTGNPAQFRIHLHQHHSAELRVCTTDGLHGDALGQNAVFAFGHSFDTRVHGGVFPLHATHDQVYFSVARYPFHVLIHLLVSPVVFDIVNWFWLCDVDTVVPPGLKEYFTSPPLFISRWPQLQHESLHTWVIQNESLHTLIIWLLNAWSWSIARLSARPEK